MSNKIIKLALFIGMLIGFNNLLECSDQIELINSAGNGIESDEKAILESLPSDLVERVSSGKATDEDLQVLADLKKLQTDSIVFDPAVNLMIDKLLQADKKRKSMAINLIDENENDGGLV